MADATHDVTELARTPLYDLHARLGARFVPFAGYEMPVQYAAGVMKEHLHTRERAGLFDVSHMGQVRLDGPDHASLAAFLESVTPTDVLGLPEGRQRYSLLLNEHGGIIDDLMVSRLPRSGDAAASLLVVLNASRKDVDIAHLQARLPAGLSLVEETDRALIALQGPAAETVMAPLCPQAVVLPFMGACAADVAGIACRISRSGYTGEDGFEISVPADRAAALVEQLLDAADVLPIGLGARDSLRLEAGLPLYGQDIDEETTPVEAALAFAINKARRPGGARSGGFPGAELILGQLAHGVKRMRVGLVGAGRAPMRGGTPIFSTETGDEPVGLITSGCFGPSVEKAISMAYVPVGLGSVGSKVFAEVRGKRLPAVVAPLPFRDARFKRP